MIAAPNWMQTCSGGKFYPADPRPEDIRIEDVAAALSKLCRFGGHCTRFYSVAEHCVHVANAAPAALKLTALLHDAAEAYLVDVPRPVKPLLSGYAEMEDRIMRAVAYRFGIVYPFPAEVKRLDNAILADERAQILAPMPGVPNAEWGAAEPPLGVTLECWTPTIARARFLTAFGRFSVDSKRRTG